jgi:hypothetical protein
MEEKKSGVIGAHRPPWTKTPSQCRHIRSRFVRVAALLVGITVLGYFSNTHLLGYKPHGNGKENTSEDPMNPWPTVSFASSWSNILD